MAKREKGYFELRIDFVPVTDNMIKTEISYKGKNFSDLELQTVFVSDILPKIGIIPKKTIEPDWGENEETKEPKVIQMPKA